jgi:hypothetical protein
MQMWQGRNPIKDLRGPQEEGRQRPIAKKYRQGNAPRARPAGFEEILRDPVGQSPGFGGSALQNATPTFSDC